MKKEVWKSSIEEISIEEAVKDFCESHELATLDINDFDPELNYFIEDNIKEISSEEREKSLNDMIESYINKPTK